MTIAQLIAYVDNVKPNAFTNDTKTVWINEVEGVVQSGIMLLSPADIIVYDYNTDSSSVLLVKAPYDKIYRAYLTAMIDFANGEYDKYNNTLLQYNAFINEYTSWYMMKYRPADGDCIDTGVYVSAYDIAVNHGFVGTEEEWLASLVGEKGDKGDTGDSAADIITFTIENGVLYYE